MEDAIKPGSLVHVDGLASEEGKKMNGSYGATIVPVFPNNRVKVELLPQCLNDAANIVSLNVKNLSVHDKVSEDLIEKYTHVVHCQAREIMGANRSLSKTLFQTLIRTTQDVPTICKHVTGRLIASRASLASCHRLDNEYKQSADVLREIFDNGGFPQDDPLFSPAAVSENGAERQLSVDVELVTRREYVKSLVLCGKHIEAKEQLHKMVHYFRSKQGLPQVDGNVKLVRFAAEVVLRDAQSQGTEFHRDACEIVLSVWSKHGAAAANLSAILVCEDAEGSKQRREQLMSIVTNDPEGDILQIQGIRQN